MNKDKTQDTESPPLPEKPKSKLSIIKILIMGFLGLLLIGGGLVAYVLMTDEPPVGKEAQAGQIPLDHRVNMPLDPFLVNLADKESRRYLKLKVEFEVDSEESQKELEKFLPHIRDGLILLLSSKTYLDLSTMEGKQQLKEEIKKRVSNLPGGKKVSNVFFTEFVAQ
jgi:flagellar FliL protein